MKINKKYLIFGTFRHTKKTLPHHLNILTNMYKNLLYLSLCFIFLFPALASAQGGIGAIEKKVNENAKKLEEKNKAIEEKKKQEQAAKEPAKDEKNSETPEDGRAIFSFDPTTEDVTTYSSGGVGEKKEEVKTPDAGRVIDSTEFQLRIASVKKREMTLYKAGLQDKAPILHNITYTKKHTLNKDFKTFGWHPFWMGDAYKSYNFSLLSAVTYFSYEVNPKDGNYKTIHDWETTPLIEMAHKSNCKVLLSISNFGKGNNEIFLANRNAQRTLILSVIDLLKKRGADGVHVDFEDVPLKRKNEFTDFLLDLNSQIKGAMPSAWVSLSLPAMDIDRVYDLANLGGQLDLFVISGYEFYGFNTQIAGPIAPIQGGANWWQWSLESSVQDYLATGLKPAKLIVAFSYYGNEWITSSLKAPSEAKKFLNTFPMYRDILRINRTPIEEPISMSSFIAYRDTRDNNRQIWFDDSLALTKKYDWIIKQKIGGVGIWALGYDNGRVELWEALAAKFAVKPSKSKANSLSWFTRMMNTVMRVMTNPMSLLRNPTSLISIFVILFGASAAGFAVWWRLGCRYSRMFNLLLKSGISIALLIALVLIIIVASSFNSWYTSAAMFMLGGIIIGAIAFLFLSRSFLVEREMP